MNNYWTYTFHPATINASSMVFEATENNGVANTVSLTASANGDNVYTSSINELRCTTDWCINNIGDLTCLTNDIIQTTRGRFNEYDDTINTVGDNVSHIKTQITQLEEENKKLKRQLSLLNTRVNDILAFFQKNNINIKE